MDRQTHWEHIYATKAPNEVSWYRPHLESSLSLIERAAKDRHARIIDVGGGESTLVDDLLAKGYSNLAILDVSKTAIEVAQARLGPKSQSVDWLIDDITTANLGERHYDIWHDRAVFHFLTSERDRLAYIESVKRSVKPGGFVIVGTFGPQGPLKCSGLDIVRYSADSLHDTFGPGFHLIDTLTEVHETPFGTTQQFVYCLCSIVA